jgi:thiamine biosynthesis protein ThiS
MSRVRFIANGKPREAADGSTVADILRELALPLPQVIVEYNGEPLERDAFGATRLRAGDRVEIAQMVGGG